MVLEFTWSVEFAEDLSIKYKDQKGALLPMLHEVQDACGCIPDEAVTFLSDSLNLSKAEVDGVVSFYHDFRRKHHGEHIIKICGAEACQAAGSEALIRQIKKRLVTYNEKSPGGFQKFSLETVFCLGNCALAPSIMIVNDLYGRVTEERFDDVLSIFGADK